MEKQSVNPGAFIAANTVLIVDKDETNRKTLGKIFSAFYDMLEAEDGRRGVDQIERHAKEICAVLLNLELPEMSGIEVLHWMKEQMLLEQIPVFLIAAEYKEEVTREAYQLGVMDVIRKPMISYVVLRRVQSVIELFETRKHLSAVVGQQNLSMLEQAEKTIRVNQGMLEGMATAIEFRNGESGGHVQRISQITRLMLENTEFGAGLSKKEIKNIALAAIMHDVGKIAIPDAILTKPGKLTPAEFEIMKGHTIQGVSILETIPQLRDSRIYDYACDIARHHHERWDGAGYPDKLVGDEISPWAQVVSLADVYDALSCRRVYKPALPREVVLEMIRTGQCGVFNPRLLECFFSIEERIFELYRELPSSADFEQHL